MTSLNQHTLSLVAEGVEDACLDRSSIASDVSSTACSSKIYAGQGRPHRAVELALRLQSESSSRAMERCEKEEPQDLVLPGIDDFMRAMSNHIARSSLFAPIAKGPRKFHVDTPLVTRRDAVMSYTGEQFDEPDADLTFQLIQEGHRFPLGSPVTLNRAALLRALDRETGKSQYAWLHRRIKALTVGTLFIEARTPDGSTKYRVGDTDAFHIVQSFRYNHAAESYTFTLDPRWAVLFSNREFALIDWNKRLRIRRGQDMAKAMQRLLATSSNQRQSYALDWLKEKMQYGSPMRKFRQALDAAMHELERVEIIAAWRMELSAKRKEQLTIWLPEHRHSVPPSSA
ncbi:plasmid replication initiator TrfA [Paraburkholderia sp. BR10882]|uniref:plasmid replication initiator TrfA n=1 Tax=unclassified Paraburkholderia TaxID=2615204 RepID=UPI0034CE09E1